MTSAKRGQEWEVVCSRSFAILDNCTVMKMGAPVRVIRFTKRGPGRKAKGGEFIGYFEGRGSNDYEGGYKSKAVSIEAKRTNQPRLSFRAIAEHQQKRMETTLRMGGLAGVLLAFDASDGSTVHFGVPWADIDGWMASGSKSTCPCLVA